MTGTHWQSTKTEGGTDFSFWQRTLILLKNMTVYMDYHAMLSNPNVFGDEVIKPYLQVGGRVVETGAVLGSSEFSILNKKSENPGSGLHKTMHAQVVACTSVADIILFVPVRHATLLYALSHAYQLSKQMTFQLRFRRGKTCFRTSDNSTKTGNWDGGETFRPVKVFFSLRFEV